MRELRKLQHLNRLFLHYLNVFLGIDIMSNWETLSLPSIAKTKFVNKVLIAKTTFVNKVLQQSLCERIVPILPECILATDILTD